MSIDFTGTWQNQHGSVLELSIVAGSVVDGRFDSGVGDDGQTIWAEVSGRVLEDVITFCAVYERFGTVVTWLGQHTDVNGTGQIRTLWVHGTNVPDPQEKDWMWFSNRIGADVFTRV